MAESEKSQPVIYIYSLDRTKRFPVDNIKDNKLFVTNDASEANSRWQIGIREQNSLPKM